MIHKLLIVSLLIGISISDTTQKTENVANSNIQNIIEKNAKRFLKAKNVNSVSIGIVKSGEKYSGHYGEITKGKGDTPNDETLYEIGSVTKTLTGFILAKAVIEEKIDLEVDIRNYFNGDFSNLEFNKKPITVRNLITHTSGLPLFLPNEMNGLYETLAPNVPEKYLELEKEYDKERFFDDLGEYTLTQEPGTRYSYSNVGTEILGYILEKTYNKSIDQLYQEIFTQYGLEDTQIMLNTEQEERLVKGYWLSNDLHSPNNLNALWATGSGAKMTMSDMLDYAKLQLDDANEVVKESHRILSDKQTSRTTAYLWDVKQDKYGTYYNHHGGTSGVQNWLFIFPKYEVAISIITNHSSAKTPRLLSKTAKNILDNLLKLD